MKEKTPKKYAVQVIPLIPLPLLRDASFTYEFPESIAEGSLVRIPFGRRNIRGIVGGSSAMTHPLPFRTRPVSAILTPAFLTPAQIDLARMVSARYFAPLGVTLRHFIAKQVIERKKVRVKTPAKLPIPMPSPPRKKILSLIMKGSRAHLLAESPEEKQALFLALAQKILAKKKGQLLILVPDILLAREYFEVFGRYFEHQSLALISSNVSSGAYYTSWEAIRDGRARIVIGTRQTLFAPFRDLSMILMDFDGHDSYKQWDMMPRYEAHVVAGHLASLHQARFVTVSPAPNIRNHFETEHKGMPIYGESVFDDESSQANIILSDLKLDRYKKNFSPFSLLTIEHIRETMRRGRRILLIVNRQGTSVFSVCERCKEVLRCPDCERALIGTDAGSYRCLHCAYRTDAFPSCPNCGSLNFKNMGFGTEKLERDLRRSFARARIRRVDASARRLKQDETSLLRDAHAGKIDILIGTEAALLAPALPDLGLIVLLDGDNVLRFPDYQAEERFLRGASIALFRATSLPRETKIIIQTFHSEHPLFQSLLRGKATDTISDLGRDREPFSYPPFGTVIKCSAIDADASKAEQSIEQASRDLEAGRRSPGAPFFMSAPVIPLSPKIRGKNICFIILRIPGQTIPDDLGNILRKLSDRGLIIDRQPLSLS
jgi:primosomal protein N' (replication factor Y)